MLACTYRFDKYEALGLAVELHKAASLFEVRCFFEVLLETKNLPRHPQWPIDLLCVGGIFLSLYEGIAVGCEKFFAL